MRGGARTTSGPAPDPNALARERDEGEWTLLPAHGRGKRAAPVWPLPEPQSRELELWRSLWVKPQALMWERNGQEIEVALYVRRLTEAEWADSAVNLSTLVRQMGDSLGLTTPGMRNNRWKIVADEVAPRRVAAATRTASKSRLKVVKDSGAADV